MNPSPASTGKVPTVRDVSGLLIIGCIFTAVGGYMDAYSYLAHGHVFANAQTGNVVFFSVFASAGRWAQALRHLPPIAAFALGVAVAQLLGVRPQKRTFRATLICQAFELVMLTGLAVFGNHLPDALAVPIISFVAAIQNSSFERVGPWAFNSAMTTGNLRDATSGLVLWIARREPEENRVKGIVLGLICLAFLAGALCGASYTRFDEKHALVPCIAIVGTGFLFTWRERRARMLPQNQPPARS